MLPATQRLRPRLASPWARSRRGSCSSTRGIASSSAQHPARAPGSSAARSLTCKASAPELEAQPLPSDVPEPVQGQVTFAGDGLAVVDKLDVGAPVGAKVRFDSGAEGMLLWAQPTGECYVAVTADAGSVAAGQAARCVILGVKDRLKDEVVLDFAMLEVPVGDHLQGCVVDYMSRERERAAGAPPAPRNAPPSDRPHLPLLNEQVPMADREVINEPLFTGIKGVDVVAPLARGCSMLLVGPRPEQQSAVMHAMLAHQAASGVHAVYAAAGRPDAAVQAAADRMRTAGAMSQCTIVAASADASLGAQYATLCAAVAIGEDIRDRGGHALVALDSMDCAVRLWDSVTKEAASSGGADAQDDTMVELNGMLVSASAAQRRQFFSALIQRASKKRRGLGGGSLTLLLALPGVPASGERTVAGAAALASGGGAPVAMENYQHLSPELKAKLAAALAAKAKQQTAAGEEGHTRTEIIEEMMSITDGQIVLCEASGDALPTVDIARSLSRMGTRAYYPAIRDYGPKARLELSQVSDAERFVGAGMDAAQQRLCQRAELLQALLQQAPGERTGLGELACMLCALSNGRFDGCSAANVQATWQDMWTEVRETAPDALERIEETKLLVAEDRRALLDACNS